MHQNIGSNGSPTADVAESAMQDNWAIGFAKRMDSGSNTDDNVSFFQVGSISEIYPILPNAPKTCPILPLVIAVSRLRGINIGYSI